MKILRKLFLYTSFFTLLSCFLIPVLAADVWYTGTADPDSTNNPFQPTAIAIDGSGFPHIACTSGDGGLEYVKWNGSMWDVTTLSSGATFPSLALDAGDRAHIGYYRDEWNNSALMYVAEDASGGWQAPEFVDEDGGRYSSIALDAGGFPHISYAGGTVPRALKYACWNGTAWEVQTVPGASGVDTPTALALDSSGNPHIAYWDSSTYRLWYASCDGTSWSRSYVAWTNAFGGWPSLALDPAGIPHLSYFIGSATGSSAVVHATCSGSWTSRTVDYVALTAGLFGGYHTSVALDGSLRPHISYYDGANGDLKYAWYDGSQWQKLVVDGAGDVGYGSSLALDDAGYPHIGYYDVTNSALKYAAMGPEPVAGFTATPAGGIAPVTVQFTDTSTGATVWSWDLGDGSVSAQQHPEHTYTAGGLYDVSLTASSIFGSDTVTRPEAVAIVQVSNFTANRTVGAVPMAVRFTDTTEGAVTGRNWTFGDGSGSTEANPVHTFQSPGLFTVSLTTTSAAGSNTLTRTGYIEAGYGPVSDFTADVTEGAVPLVVGFTDRSSCADAWLWDFGDGENATLQNVSHTYTEAGYYTVSLHTANSYGDDTLVRTRTITATPGVTGISPASAMVNTAPCLNLSGTGFANGMAVSLSRIGRPAINATKVTVTGATTLSCTVDLANASWGPWDVAVTSPAGPSGMLAEGFEVIWPVPVLSAITPVSGVQDRIVGPVDLAGSGFLPGATVELVRAAGDAVAATGVAVTAGDRMTCLLDLGGTEAGAWDVTVTNPDGKFAILPGGFTVIAALKPTGGGGATSFSFTGDGIVRTSSTDGKVLKETTITSADGIAELTLPRETVALDGDGNPLTGITITALGEVPETPGGAVFTFAGYAYACTPAGATFDPAITLTFTLSEEEWEAPPGEDFTVRFYNEETGLWEEVPATVDPVTHTVTATVTHFTVFALFAEATGETAPAVEKTTAGPTVTAEPAADTAAPEPTATPEGPLVYAPVLGVLAFLLFARRR